MNFCEETYVTQPQMSIELLEERIKTLEVQLNMLKDKELNILNSIPALVVICDINEKIIFANKTFQYFLGYSYNEDLYELELKKLLTSDSLIHVRKKYPLILKNGQAIFLKEIKVFNKQKEIQKLSVAISKYNYTHEGYGFVAIGNLPDEFLDNSLHEMNQSLLKFISIIAHDLRNPFNSLIGFSNLLAENYDMYTDEKRKEYIYHLQNASHQGFQLLDNLLEWSRITTGAIKPSPITFLLNDIIDNTIKLLESNILKKDITLHVSLMPNLILHADPNMIQAALRNIISNAIKFTHRSGQIEVIAFKQKHNAIVEIKDNGVGMAPSTVKNLFKIGSNISSKGTEGEKGTGMGLLLCKEFVELNGGKITVQSILGKGSSFKIKLPLA